MARLSSESGSVEVPVIVTDEMTPGTVALPHGWGHRGGWRLANEVGGVNVNQLASPDPASLERLAGMAHLNGIPVRVEAVAAQDGAGIGAEQPAVPAWRTAASPTRPSCSTRSARWSSSSRRGRSCGSRCVPARHRRAGGRCEARDARRDAYYRAHHHEGTDEPSLRDLRRRCADVLREHLPQVAAPREDDLVEALLASLRFRPYADAAPFLGRLRLLESGPAWSRTGTSPARRAGGPGPGRAPRPHRRLGRGGAQARSCHRGGCAAPPRCAPARR